MAYYDLGLQVVCIRLNEPFHLLKGFIVDGGPWKIFCGFGNIEKIGKPSENVGATRPHVPVVGDNTEECTKFFHVFRCLYCEDGFDFLWTYGLIPRGVSQCPRKLVS